MPTGATLLSQNAKLMALYLERYGLSIDDFDGFALNAHANANHNPNALFHDRTVTAEQVDASRSMGRAGAWPPRAGFAWTATCRSRRWAA